METPTTPPPPSAEACETGDASPRTAELTGFLRILEAVLESRRLECHRPEAIERMTEEELAQEKIDLQKCLLYFECEKGHPSNSASKRVMKPIYDRYRTVRRLVRLSSTAAVPRRPSDASAPTASVSRGKKAVNAMMLQRARSSGATPFEKVSDCPSDFIRPAPKVELVAAPQLETAFVADALAILSSTPPPPLPPPPHVVVVSPPPSTEPLMPLQTEDTEEQTSYTSNTATSTTAAPRETPENGQRQRGFFLDWTISLAE